MNRSIFGFAVVLSLLAFVTPGWAKAINGKLEKIDGQFFVVKDVQGKEHRIHFDTTTQQTGVPIAGKTVEIDENNGHAKSIKVVEAMPPVAEQEGGVE
jgi:hypothetical protein